jgi:[ribosomal protein S18]-alanine N-acetyltransferase
VTIRPATPADLPFISALERACPTAAQWTEHQYEQLFNADKEGPERLVLVASSLSAGPLMGKAQEASSVAGFLVARHVSEEWELENVVVASAERRKGLGKRLLDALLRHAERTNSKSVLLEVRESNAPARSVYEKAGFRQTGRRKAYYMNPLEDAILYSRNVP